MSNGHCHIGAANKARIDANEKRIGELSNLIEETLRHFEEMQQELLNHVDLIRRELTSRLDQTVHRFAGRPSWAMMLALTGLTSLCVGLIVHLLNTGT
jgi:HPt (histidine-containing phosphotransfer) domain-containing protein